MKKQFQIVGIGEVLWDIYPGKMFLGGAVSNSVYHINKLGHKGILISKVGEDKLGKELLSELKKKGMSVDYVQVDPDRKTGTVTVILDKDAVPSFRCPADTAYEFIDWDEKFEKLMNSTDALLFGTLVQINPHARKTLYKLMEKLRNTVFVYDVNLRGWPGETKDLIEKSLYYSDILKLNFNEFNKLRKDLNIDRKDDIDSLKVILEKYKLKMIALSLGSQGGLFIHKEEVVYIPGIGVQPVDTTGAGDAFIAGIIVKYLEKAQLHVIGEFSNCLGAFLTTKKGATPDYSLSTFESFKMKSVRNFFHRDYKKFVISS